MEKLSREALNAGELRLHESLGKHQANKPAASALPLSVYPDLVND